MGTQWSHNHAGNLRQDASDWSGNNLTLQLPSGAQRKFSRLNASAAWTNATHAGRLAATAVNGVPAWRYTDAEDDSQWVFTQPNLLVVGKLLSHQQRNGWTTTYSYTPAGQLSQVSNQFGRSLQLSYFPSGLLASVTAVSGAVTQYTWDTNSRLSRVTHPDGSTLSYHFEDSRWPQYITGITDENLQRYQTVSYDSLGRATSSSLGSNIDRYSVAYSGSATGFNSSATVTDPIGTQRTFGYTQTKGHTDVTSGSNLPGCKGEPPIASRTQTPGGLLASETDFLGRTTRYDWDSLRMLTTRITRAEGTAQAQSTTIAWHPSLRLPTDILESDGKRTVNTYDALGNLIQQDVTKAGDVSSNRTWKWTYNAAGLVETETDPRNGVFSYVYNAQGQLTSRKNPRNHTTSYGYDTAGRVNRITQPNGLIQRFIYNLRGWVTSQSQAAGGSTLTTAYTYTPSGQIKTAALPNGHVITYQHDVAQRVIGWSDNRGQSAAYVLDALGNLTSEQHRSGNGNLALQINRSINAINRLENETTGNSVVTRYTYDANGRVSRIQDAANRSTTLGRDALDRVTTITDAAAKTARLAYNAQDDVSAATDFKGVKTDYNRDAQGNAKTEASPDIGTTTALYNGIELPTKVTDALGRATAITRDTLGRPTKIVHGAAGAPTLTSLLTYDTAGTACNAPGHTLASKGQLCTLVDQVGTAVHATTQYQWDSFGRLTQQTQTLSSAVADFNNLQTTAYSYLASGPGAGQLASLTYPSGAVLTHSFDTTGRLIAMALNGQPLLSDIKYNALEQPLSWTWAFATPANSLKASRVYNTAGQLTNAAFASFTPNNLGQIAALEQGLFKANASGVQIQERVPFSALYNAVGQLTNFSATAPTAPFQYSYSYTWDANGNRTGGSTTLDGVSAAYTSTVPTSSNRPTTQAGINVVTNAAGDVTSLLGKTIAYDTAGRVSQVTAIPPCPTGLNCQSQQTTLSRYNGHNQRVLRETDQGQTVFVYGPDGYSVLFESEHRLVDATTVSTTTETIYLPPASGPMPVVAVINGAPYAIHADHLNTPRRLTDAQGRPRWQWAFSGLSDRFGLMG